VLSLGEDGRIRIEPVRQLEGLRAKHARLTNIRLREGSRDGLRGVGGDALDIVAEFDPEDADEFGLKVRASGDGREETLIYVDRRGSRFMMDLTRSSLAPDAERRLVGDAFEMRPGALRLRILVDRSVIEAFADGRAAIAGRAYPTLRASVSIEPYVKGGTARLRSLDVWRMKSIW
jgi:sucrose-6-phosphate hydrolase SacC (GH32 family)